MKRINIEQLWEDMLSDDFVQLFYSIHFIQRILGRIRVNMKYKFVTAPSTICRYYSCLLSFSSILSTIVTVVHCRTVYAHNATNFLLKMLIATNEIMNVIIAWQNNFQNCHLNSQLYVKLHNIDREIHMHGSEHINGKLIVPFLVSTVLVMFLGILWVSIFNVLNMQEFCFASVMTQIFGLGIYTDMVLYIYIMYYIGIRVTYINSLLETEPIASNAFGIVDKRIWMVTEFKKSDCGVGSSLVVGVHSILQLLKDLLELYQIPILFYIGQLLLNNLLVMQSYITMIKAQDFNFRAYTSLLPVLLSTLVIIKLCLFTAAVESKLDQMRLLCNKILSSQVQGKSRYNAKRILTLLEAKSNMTIYNIFDLNTRLPLNLLAVTATHAILLFQFALL